MTDPEPWRPNRTGPWAAVDAGLLRNPKVAALRPPARWLYVAGILHCADELTDGRIARHALPRLLLEAGARRPNIAELEAAGLWEAEPDGWAVRDYLAWNPPKTHWESQRKRNAEKQSAWRERQRQASTHPDRNRLRNPSPNGSVPRLTRRNEVTRGIRTTQDHGEQADSSPYVDPTASCPDCGERTGHGHLETCPRMPAIVDPAA